jgi:ParB family chromosome partitioning protein
MSLEDWQIAIARIAKNCATAQKTGTLCTVISPNYRDVANGLVVMTTDIIRSLWELAGYILHDKAYSSRRIQQIKLPTWLE